MANLERSTAAAPAPTTPQMDIESLPSLFGRLGDDVMKLVDTKLTLLKVEVKEETGAYVRDGLMISVGGVIAAIGFALVNIAVAFFVATLLPYDPPVNYALGFLITGAVYVVIGAIIIFVMKNRLTRRDPVPERSVEELRKDKQWLKKEI
jgi:uncharacterized membrane protein YqjE